MGIWGFCGDYKRQIERDVFLSEMMETERRVFIYMHVCMNIDVGWLGIIRILDPLPTTILR